MDKIYTIIIYIYFLCLLFLVNACTQNNNIETSTISTEYSQKLFKKEKICFPLDDRADTKAVTILPYYGKNNKNYLTFLSKSENAILFYYLHKNELAFKVKYKLEGPNGVGSIYGYTIVDFDSIFVLGTRGYKGYLTDTSAVVKETFVLEKSDAETHSVDLSAATREPITVKDDKLIFKGIPGGEAFASDRYKYSIFYYWDLLNNEFKSLDFPLPENLYKDKHWVWTFQEGNYTVNDKGQFVVSHEVAPYLRVTDFNETQTYESKSDYIDDIPPLSKPDIESGLRQWKTENYYRDVAYDKYRNVYYRFALHRQELIDEKTGDENPWDSRSWSIIIMDSAFNKIGEKYMPPKQYFFRDWFITEEGLFISNNNDNNPNLDEDCLSFTLFELKDV